MRPELLEPFARTIVGALGAGILESALLAFVILGLTKVRPRPSATTRHVFWWSALAASVALPLVSIAFSFGHVEHRRVVEAPPRTAAAAWRQLPPQRTQEARPQGQRPSDAAALSSPIRISGSRIVETPAIRDDSAVSSRWAADVSRAAGALVEARAVASRAVSAIDSGFTGLALVAVWLNVVIFGLFSLGRSFRTLRALKRNASPLDEQLLRRLRRGRHASRLGRSVALAVSNEIDVPVAVGFRNPTILMPIGVVEREAAADIDQIAMHEDARLARPRTRLLVQSDRDVHRPVHLARARDRLRRPGRRTNRSGPSLRHLLVETRRIFTLAGQADTRAGGASVAEANHRPDRATARLAPKLAASAFAARCPRGRRTVPRAGRHSGATRSRHRTHRKGRHRARRSGGYGAAP